MARNARDKDDLAHLLDALGLPCTEDDLVRLLPHLTHTDHSPAGESMTSNAFTATAVSMLNKGNAPAYVRSTLGLSDDELAEAVKLATPPAPTTAPTPDRHESTGSPGAAAQTLDAPAYTGGIEGLLSWAENHPAARIRNRAARMRSDLGELSDRRAADAAHREAQERVAKATAELEAAQAELRAVKAGGRPTKAGQDTPRPEAKRTPEELAAIRTWARANGHRVAGRGNPAKAVLDAYDAAHHTNNRAEAI
ncbi:histone-like nucleoid-structuring protein Lsr2 [Streptomyces sp. NPDC029554]|uniref:Lsr2 family DNA-binding protein n=1 Tax=Streptomyces sp. NPDC029554 TaxID=3155126 RepID=UPI0033CAFCA9